MQINRILCLKFKYLVISLRKSFVISLLKYLVISLRKSFVISLPKSLRKFT